MFEKEPQNLRPEAIPEEAKEVEGKESVLDIISHPIIQKGLANYKIFSEYYFGNKLQELSEEEFKKYGLERAPSRAEVKQRADELYGEDGIYKGILKLGESSDRAVENKDFVSLIAGKIGKEALNELEKAKKEGRLDEALVNVVSGDLKKSLEENRDEKCLMVGKIIVGIDKKHPEILRPHIGRVAENAAELNKIMRESYRILAEGLQVDKEFKHIQKLEGISWLIGEGIIRGGVWHNYSVEEMEKFKEEDPELYKNIQKTGARSSPKFLKKYLLTGELPKLGGQWITKKEFIERYGA